jgi:glycosyltransferase involved in cell wall biosynthesis
MTPLISICIPTYNRPDLLRLAIESCLQQTYADIEIVISDDSTNDDSSELIQQFAQPEIIKYHHNRPSLRQAENVNRLFDLAQGDRLVLLHDDDLLLPDAIQKMVDCWTAHPEIEVCFGKQYIITMTGDRIESSSEQLNQDYYRSSQYAGFQQSSLWSALAGQFPNDGYMVLTKAARSTRYRNDRDISHACDFEFGLRLAAHCTQFFFLDDYTADYRVTETSISSDNNYSHLSYKIIESLTLPPDLEVLRATSLRKYASPAINAWLGLGNIYSASQIYTSGYYSWSQRLSPKGLLQFLLLLCPASISSSLTRLMKNQKRKSFSTQI